jgi:type IV pilus assembly protein PilX
MPAPHHHKPLGPIKTQRGAVLIIALIMLGLLSLMAATSLRHAQSTESMAGNARTTELARQAAETALQHCEASLIKFTALSFGDTSSAKAQYPTTFTDAHIHPITKPPAWQDAAGKWDTPSNHVFVLPLSLVGNSALYKRAPECMVESINRLLPDPVQPEKTATPDDGASSNFIITARGFGPEVAPASPQRLRPVGSEIWLQTQVSLARNTHAVKSRSWRPVFLR